MIISLEAIVGKQIQIKKVSVAKLSAYESKKRTKKLSVFGLENFAKF